MQGYNQSIEECIQTEFPHLNGITYLDHTGATLYAAGQLSSYRDDLLRNAYGNPHSRSNSSQLSTDTIEQVRYRVLKHFNTTSDHHSVIFTSGCTGALKLLANAFDWSGCSTAESSHNAAESSHNATESSHNAAESSLNVSESSHNVSESSHKAAVSSHHAAESSHNTAESTRHASGLFCYLEDNHTSVVGMREIAKEKKANIIPFSPEKIDHVIQNGIPEVPREVPSLHQNHSAAICNCLFAFPGQSNFSGRKYPLSWCSKVKQGQLSQNMNSSHGNWYVVVDAAALAATSEVDLSTCAADFVTVSFYKMFGFPSGLGGLIVRKGAERVLRKGYFGGGTVQAYLSGEQFHVPKMSLADWFEDGTVPFLEIVAVRHGLDVLQRLAGNMKSIHQHTFALAKYVHDNMSSYRHGNGSPIARIYCHDGFTDSNEQGPIINFNLLRPNGEFVGYAEVENLAALHDIHLRTGCFCNTGACQNYLGMSSKQLKENFQAGHVCGDDMDIIDGQPTGSVRISFGYMSTRQDADRFLAFIRDAFVKKTSSLPPAVTAGNSGKMLAVTARYSGKEMVLTNIFLYPVKSCGAMEVSEWELGSRGLLYDRHWMVVNSSGVCLSQKRESKMCLIKPSVDLKVGILRLTFPGLKTLELPLEIRPDTADRVTTAKVCQSKVCGDRVEALDCGDTAADWLSSALGKQCRLLQENNNFKRDCKFKEVLPYNEKPQVSLANESPYLLLSRSSCKVLLDNVLKESVGDNEPLEMENLLGRFRGNFVIDHAESFVEDKWKKLQIGQQVFMVGGLCSRCQMICINQDTAKRSKEPLTTLTTFRGRRVPFGLHLLRDPCLSTSTTISVNDAVTILEDS